MYMQRRFLRARNHDVQKAKAMFMAHIHWRKEFGADTLDEFVFHERDAIISLYPQGYHKTDKMVSHTLLQLYAFPFTSDYHTAGTPLFTCCWCIHPCIRQPGPICSVPSSWAAQRVTHLQCRAGQYTFSTWGRSTSKRYMMSPQRSACSSSMCRSTSAVYSTSCLPAPKLLAGI